MSRFFVEPSSVGESYITLTSKEDIHHLTRVLRKKPGDEIDISDGKSWEYKTVLEEVENGEAVLRIIDKQAFAREPSLMVTLFQGMPKAAKLETVIQKTVELGVFSIEPVFMDRSIVTEKSNIAKKLERWQKISNEAVKQCKRGIIPQVEAPVDFEQMMKKLENFDLVLFPYENEENYTIKDSLKKITESGKRVPRTVAIIIGPEGGFSDREAEMLTSFGAEKVSLGSTILRTETAGMAALAMTMYELEL